MEKRAKEFLELAGKMYEQNKTKWSNIVDGFDEDVYSDTILKVYDSILKGVDTEGDLQGYWFRAFKNNLNKNHKQDIIKEDVEQTLKDKEDEINNINLYYSTISNILYKVTANGPIIGRYNILIILLSSSVMILLFITI